MHTEIRVQEADFDLGAVTESMRARQRDIGAIASFVGVVREHTASVDAAARGLYLEHYPGVTERSLQDIVDRAAARWPLLDVVVVHRVGWLAPTEQIVLVVVGSAHRHAAFAACAYVMDYLKTDAVFWKKERRADGSEAWIESTAGDHHAAAEWHRPPG
jgi:molybdopterin synthase catalytic subunit